MIQKRKIPWKKSQKITGESTKKYYNKEKIGGGQNGPQDGWEKKGKDAY